MKQRYKLNQHMEVIPPKPEPEIADGFYCRTCKNEVYKNTRAPSYYCAHCKEYRTEKQVEEIPF